MHGDQHNIQAIGLESLTEGEHAPEVAKLKRFFSEACEEATKTFSRRHGTIDILLGMSSRSLHCKNVSEAGDLRLNKSVFIPEWVWIG